MVLGRTHRARLRFPIHFTAPDRSRTYVGETFDIAVTGFSVQVRTEEDLPRIIVAGILPTKTPGDAILCKARLVWKGGVSGEFRRASYRITSISEKSRQRLEEIIRNAIEALIEELQDFSAFSGTSASDLETLISFLRNRDFPEGARFLGSEEKGSYYILMDGEAEAFGCETDRFGPGAILARPEGAQEEFIALAATPLRTLYLSESSAEDLEQEAPHLMDHLRALACKQPSARASMGPRRKRLKVELLRDLQEIPTLPAVFNAIIDCMDDPDATPKDLALLIAKDQSLTAKVLKTVNSALYGFPRRITSVDEAVVLLGMTQTANLAITATLLNTLGGAGEGGERPELLWEHSLASAYFAQSIGERLRSSALASAGLDYRPASNLATLAKGQAAGATAVQPPATEQTAPARLDRLFTYAILHDIGLVILFLKFPDAYELVMDSMDETKDFHSCELELLDGTHCELGYRVAVAWGLPEPIPTVIANHHLPTLWARAQEPSEVVPRLRENSLITVLSLADMLARVTGIGAKLDAGEPTLPPALPEALGLGTEDLEAILAEADTIRQKSEAFFRGMAA